MGERRVIILSLIFWYTAWVYIYPSTWQNVVVHSPETSTIGCSRPLRHPFFVGQLLPLIRACCALLDRDRSPWPEMNKVVYLWEFIPYRCMIYCTAEHAILYVRCAYNAVRYVWYIIVCGTYAILFVPVTQLHVTNTKLHGTNTLLCATQFCTLFLRRLTNKCLIFVDRCNVIHWQWHARQDLSESETGLWHRTVQGS